MEARRRPGRGQGRGLIWPAALLLGLGLAGAWALWGRRSPPPPPPKPTPVAAPARMETLSLTEIQEGGKRWVLEAEKADFHKDRLEINISGVRVEFYGTSGEYYKVKGTEGVLNTKTRVLTLRGQVELQTGDLVIKTSVVTYFPGERVLEAPEDVTLDSPKLRVQGKGLKVQLAEKKLALSQHRLTEVKTQDWGLKR